jgi:type 1 glutamine amidotransferase
VTEAAAPDVPYDAAMPTDTLLHVTQVAPYLDGPAGVHGVLGQSATALAELAETRGMRFEQTSDVRTLDPAVLERARVLALFTIGETPWSESQQTTILDAVRSGRTSVLALHSATDSCHGWDEYGLLVGARFDGHPWTQSFGVEVVDRSHPAVAHLGPVVNWHDEVYTFRDLRPDARVLLRARADDLDSEVEPVSGEYPLAWCFEEGAGRVFYSALGHFPLAWETPDHLRYLDGGLGWVLEAS